MMEAVDVPSTSKEEGTIGLTTRRTKRIAGRPPSSTGQQVVLISKDNEEELTLSSGKPRRWETWTSPEQAAFFDAVKQVGKDFDAIVRLMAKRKVKKDKEQIRNYYYNTYKQTKLNAGFADDQPSDNFAFPVPREAKELFVLVNLAEWRKKTSDRKIEPVKFRELVLKGSTSVRLKGKRVPVLIKTPACPALKKFCEEPGKQREKQMPTDVTLELVPMSFGDKAYVLRCEQNPFLRLKLGVVEPLKRYFDYVRNKWIPSDLRLREEYLAGETASMLPDISFYADSSVKMGRVVIQHADVLPTICLRLCSEMCEQQPGLFSKKKWQPTTAISVDAMAACPPATCVADDTDSDTNDAEPGMPMDTPLDSAALLSSAQLSEMSSGEQDPASTTDDCAATSTGDESKEDWIPSGKEATVALDESKLAQGLTADNVGNATAAELCLICNAASVIRLTYSITPAKAAIRSDPWKLFMTVVARNYGEHVYKALNTVEQPGPAWVNGASGQKTPSSADASNKKRARFRDADGQSPCTPMNNSAQQNPFIRNNVDVGLIHRIGLSGVAVDSMPNSEDKKKKSRASKQIQLVAAVAAPTAPSSSATVVRGENQSFAYQMSLLSKGKCLIRTNVQTNPVGVQCRQVVASGPTKEAIVVGQSESPSPAIITVPNASQQVTQSTKPNESPAASSAQYAQLKASSAALASPAASALQKTPDRTQRKRKADKSDRLQPAMLDFSTLAGFPSTSMEGHSASSSSSATHHAPPPAEHQSGNSRMTLITPGHSVDEFSPLKAMSNLPDDVRVSFEMMMQQSSIDYCRNFEALVETLETPKKQL